MKGLPLVFSPLMNELFGCWEICNLYDDGCIKHRNFCQFRLLFEIVNWIPWIFVISFFCWSLFFAVGWDDFGSLLTQKAKWFWDSKKYKNLKQAVFAVKNGLYDMHNVLFQKGVCQHLRQKCSAFSFNLH